MQRTVEPLLTVAEVAAVTRQSRSTIWRLIRRGALPIIRPVKGSVRIASQDLREYLERQREGPK